MASTVLPNGIIIPEKFSRDWYADLYHNWQELDNLLGGGTPKDGTLTIQKNGATVGTFSANQSTNETINITVPDVNDATLTIQKNGTDVTTFSANASTNATANIIVPTKTSDLTNDSGFITSDDTKIPLAGSNAISGSLIPSTDGTVNLGGPSHQWNTAYIKNYYYNGVQWGLDKANVWTNTNTFTAYVESIGSAAGGEYSSNARTNLWLMSNRDTEEVSGILFDTYRQNTAQGTGMHILGIGIKENSVRYEGCRWGWYWDNNLNGYIFDFKPTTQGANQALKHNLGTSVDKWNTLNGINPGALSLPSNSYINVDTTNWDLTCQNGLLGSFTPTADGWLMLSVDNSGTSEVNFWIIGGVIRINNKSSINTTDNNNFNMFTIPVEKDVTYNIYGNASEYVAGRSIAYCRFMPCRGNV